MGRPFKPIPAGTKFGLWTVLNDDKIMILSYEKTPQYDCHVLVQCDCSLIRLVLATRLRSRGSSGCQSCAISHSAHTTEITRISLQRRHGVMMSRCYNPKHLRFPRYGGRNIKVEDFLQDSENYQQYVKSLPRKSNQTSIDRIDNNRNYERGNLAWASAVEQSQNREITILIEYNNQTMPLSMFSRLYCSCKYTTVATRYYRGWTAQEIINNKREKKHVTDLDDRASDSRTAQDPATIHQTAG